MNVTTIPLSSIADVKLGRQRSPQNHTGPSMRKYLRAANVGWDGLILDDVKCMNFTNAEMASFRLEPGDLLLNEASGSPREVGKPAIWQGEIDDCAFQNTLLRVRPGPDIDARYLLHFFKHEAAKGAFARGARGVGIHHLGREALARWPVPLPPLDEQRRIAAILDQADALRAKRRQVLLRLGELTKAFFVDMFADIPPTAVLGECGEIQGGLQVTSKRDNLPVEFPYLRVANVYRGRLDLSDVKTIRATRAEAERARLMSGDLLFVEGHGNPDEVGRVAVWDGSIPNCLHQNHLIRVRLDDTVLLPAFAVAWFNSTAGASHFRRAGKTTSGLNTISTNTVRCAPVPIPSMKKQHAFSKVMRQVDCQAKRWKKSIGQLDALFASLVYRAFSGKLCETG